MVIDAMSLCHRLAPGTRLALTLAVILAAGLLPARLLPAQGLLLVAVVAALCLAEVSLAYVARRLVQFAPLLLVFGLTAPALRSEGAAWEWTIALWTRCTTSFLAGLWLIHVLPFRELLTTLRRWHCPLVLIAMLSFMYRYSFVLWDELRRLRNARSAREFTTPPWWRAWGIGIQSIGLLLLRALERAERTHRAMLARGWDGSVRLLDLSEDATDVPR